MECLEEAEAYIRVKDHREGFPHKPSFRLINLSKVELGKVSKRILDKINKYIIEHTKANQWKKSTSVTEWAKAIKSRQQCTFIVFDIESFYPSTLSDVFNKPFKFGKEIIAIADSDLTVMMHSTKTLLFHEMNLWSNGKAMEILMFPWDAWIKQKSVI